MSENCKSFSIQKKGSPIQSEKVIRNYRPTTPIPVFEISFKKTHAFMFEVFSN